MDLSALVLGRGVVKYLANTQTATVLQIGRDRFGRADLAGVACFNFVAAANLSKILNSQLQVKDTRDVFNTVNPSRLALPRLGAVSLAVLGAAFEAKGLGGSEPLTNWFKKHDLKAVTFHTVKARDAADVAKEKTTAKARRQARRNTAHRIRVNRFNEKEKPNGTRPTP